MSEDETTPTPTPPETPAAAASTNATDSLISKPAKRYSLRFVILYGALAGIAIAAIVGFVVLVAKPSSTASSSGWSDWKPKHGTTATMTSEIADHVAREYHLNKKGAQLVAVVAGAADRDQRNAQGLRSRTSRSGAHRRATTGIQVVPSGKTWTMEFCGLGSQCSIASGQPSETRGRLVRREALEAALYTFKFVPAIDSVVAFMPPPAGQSQSTLLYLQKEPALEGALAAAAQDAGAPEPAAADGARHQGGGDDRPADAPRGLLVQAPAAPGRERTARPGSVPELAVLSMKARTRRQASSDASANSSCLRSKKLCGAPG